MGESTTVGRLVTSENWLDTLDSSSRPIAGARAHAHTPARAMGRKKLSKVSNQPRDRYALVMTQPRHLPRSPRATLAPENTHP